jgi:hypothetical protein
MLTYADLNSFEALEIAERAYLLVTFHGVAERDMVLLAVC